MVTKVKKKSLKSNLRSRNRLLIVFIMAFGVLGLWFLIRSQAATTNLEAENATKSSEVIIGSDAGASGGKFAQFATAAPLANSSAQRFPGDPNPRVTGKAYWGGNVFALLADGTKTSDVRARHEVPTGKPYPIHHTYHNWGDIDDGGMVRQARTGHDAGRLPYITFKTLDDWSAIGRGQYDAQFDKFIREIDALGKPVWIGIWHEPENDTNGSTRTPATWKAMQIRFKQRMNAANNGQGTKNIAFMPHFMAYTFSSGSGRNPDDWWADNTWDAIMLSNYCNTKCIESGGSSLTTNERANAIKYIEAKGMPWGLGEWSLSEKRTGPLLFTATMTEYWNWGFINNKDLIAYNYFDADESRPDPTSPYYASLRDANLDAFHNILRSDSKVMRLSDLSGGTTTTPSSYGTLTSNITVPANGTYKLWVRMSASDSTNNAISVKFDNGASSRIGDLAIPANTWTWVDYRNGSSADKATFSLAAGTRQITITGVEKGVKIDKFILTDSTCIPNGNGDNCNVVSVPKVDIRGVTNNQTVTGSASIEAVPVNATNVSQIDFFIDNILIKTEKIAPYCIGGDNSAGTACLSYGVGDLSNGSHVLKVVMTYGTNQTVQNSITLNVQNGTAVTKQGDVNGDNKIDILDLSFLLSNWDPTGTKPLTSADINKDNKVDVLDMSILLSNWGK